MTSAGCMYTLLIWSVTVVSVISDCPPGTKTDKPDRCCVFPFKYGGVSYDSCTKVGHNRLWCAFNAEYVGGQWGNCVDPCTNKPCKNGGSCTVTGDDTYSCKCPDGFEGENCETKTPCPPGTKTDKPDRCCVFPFKYGGVSYNSCTKVGHSRLWCAFNAEYVGGQWGNCVDPCTDKPCKNGGSCSVTGDDTYSCKCPDGFEGGNCETKTPCPPGTKTDKPDRCCVFPFKYGGVSYDSCTKVGHSRLWCAFNAEYVGGQWGNCVDPCTDKPCKNGGTCTVTGDNTYSCKCPDGFEGENCVTKTPCPPGTKTDKPDRCCVFPFKYGGVSYDSCTKVGHSRLWCAFNAEYVGGQWGNCVNPCTNNPCKNGGSCTVTGDDKYSCKCPAGFEGENCETEIDECKDDPCENGGTCVSSSPGSYTCNCAVGYQGDKCQEVKWNSEGCFGEYRKQTNKIFDSKFHTVKNMNKDSPDIEKVFNECKAKAEEQGYKIFAIRGVNRCIRQADNGKPFNERGVADGCKINDQGRGVGTEEINFVYTREA